jgi:hypothetical protein
VTEHGTLGVHIFFIISGFLITTLLVEEQARTGDISLGLFYARRTLRIFPPFYCFLAIIAVATWMGFLNVSLKNFLFAGTYTMNYMTTGGTWITGHIWSLSVEEQFYLAWPLTMKLAGLRRAWWIAGALAVTAPLVCLALYLIDSDLGSRVAMYFPFVADSIAAGCIVSGVLPWLRRRERIYRWFAAPAGRFHPPADSDSRSGTQTPSYPLRFDRDRPEPVHLLCPDPLYRVSERCRWQAPEQPCSGVHRQAQLLPVSLATGFYESLRHESHPDVSDQCRLFACLCSRIVLFG